MPTYSRGLFGQKNGHGQAKMADWPRTLCPHSEKLSGGIKFILGIEAFILEFKKSLNKNQTKSNNFEFIKCNERIQRQTRVLEIKQFAFSIAQNFPQFLFISRERKF